jgi:hypothetical protein
MQCFCCLYNIAFPDCYEHEAQSRTPQGFKEVLMLVKFGMNNQGSGIRNKHVVTTLQLASDVSSILDSMQSVLESDRLVSCSTSRFFKSLPSR